jgi:hypothetical protein
MRHQILFYILAHADPKLRPADGAIVGILHWIAIKTEIN